MDRSSAERGRGGCGRGVSLPAEGEVSPEFFLLFDLKIVRFGALFELDLTEETRMQLQEEEALALYWLRLPMIALTQLDSALCLTIAYICSHI